MGLWLALISLFKYPIQILAAAAAAGVAASADADALLAAGLDGTGGGLGLKRLGRIIAPWEDHTSPSASNPEQSTSFHCHAVLNTLEPMHATSTELSPGGRPTGFCLLAAPLGCLCPGKPGLV
eukprot:1155276-Pelagomonas_calceolata.AAC.3